MYRISLVIMLGYFTIANAADINGQGFLKTQGGSIKTCAGSPVYLDKFYEDESPKSFVYQLALALQQEKTLQAKMKVLGGTRNDFQTETQDIDQTKQLLNHIGKKNIVETMCDAQGNFEFYDIKPGKYRIGTTVEWFVGNEQQGGFLMKVINVNKNRNKVFITE